MNQDSLVAQLNMIAAEIKHEDNLIGQRTTWLVMAQSFLFGAFASLVGQVSSNVRAIAHVAVLLRVLIPVVGLMLPVLVLSAVIAASYAIWQWRVEHRRLREMLETKGLEWPHLENPDWVRMTGQLLPVAVALGFAMAWVVILVQLRTA